VNLEKFMDVTGKGVIVVTYFLIVVAMAVLHLLVFIVTNCQRSRRF